MTSDNGKHTLVIDECEVDKDEGAYTVKFNKELKSTPNSPSKVKFIT